MKFKTKEDVVTYIESLPVGEQTTITVAVADNALFYDTVISYNKRFARQKYEAFIQVIYTSTPCQYKLTRLNAQVLDTSVTRSRKSRVSEARDIRNVFEGKMESIEFPFSQELLGWARTHVYSCYKGQLSAVIDGDFIIVRRRDESKSLRQQTRSLINSGKLPVVINCSVWQSNYVRQVISAEYKDRNLRVMVKGDECVIYDTDQILEQARKNTAALTDTVTVNEDLL